MDLDASLGALRELEALWHRRRAGRALPRRRDFPFEDFRPWLCHIRILHVEHAPLRLKVTLDGTEIVETAGIDLTGRYLDSVYGNDRLRFLLDGYHVCIERREPVYETLRPNGRIVNFGEITRLLLPCGEDGRVDHILYCEYAHNLLHWSRSVFADLGDLTL